VARDRKRAKQRRDRRGAADARRRRDGGPTPPSSSNGPVRADVPGALDHASGDVDEFDAALVRGAGGVVPASDPDLDTDTDTELRSGGEDELQAPSTALVRDGGGDGADGGAGGGNGVGGGNGSGAGAGVPASGAPLRGGNRAVAFLRASWAELQRVQWPDRQQVFQATAVVLGFVAIAGAYLGLADYVAKEIVEFIL
jgi:preprotein translocase subunit SecE